MDDRRALFAVVGQPLTQVGHTESAVGQPNDSGATGPFGNAILGINSIKTCSCLLSPIPRVLKFKSCPTRL
jgi:hypothetical protein